MTKSMTNGNPAKLIVLFALPLIAGNIFQQFYSMADTIIVGRTIGVNALAAVGCTGSLNFFVLGFVMGFTNGLSIVTAQKFGGEDLEGVKRSFATGMVLCTVLALILTAAAVFLTRPMLEVLQTPEEIIDDAARYMKIIFWGISGSMLFNFTSNMMRALGDSRTPLYFLVLACSVNIVLDFVLILAFRMGVAGAGAATILSQLLSGICCFYYIMKKMPSLRVERRHFRLDKDEVVLHLKNAFPMAFQMSIIAIGALILQYALNGLGAVSVAAYTAAQKIDSIATMPLNSFGAAMATYTAQNYGAQKYGRIRKGVFQCICISVSVSIIMGILNNIAGSNLAAVFVGSGEKEVLEQAKTYLSITGILYWVLALLFIYRFTLQGLGNGVVPTIAGIMELIMRAFGAVILVAAFGFPGACWSNTLAWIGACIPLSIAYYISIHKLTRKKKMRRSCMRAASVA